MLYGVTRYNLILFRNPKCVHVCDTEIQGRAGGIGGYMVLVDHMGYQT